MGAEKTVILGEQRLADEVRAWTEGYGVDAVVVCTATPNNTPVEQAAEALRERGCLVIVGNTRAELAWKVFYEKELEVRYSRSYGPGRYDPSYEWGGSDYPISYVRWTEQRNFEASLHLMKTGQLNLAGLTTRRVPFAQALEVYRDLLGDGTKDVGVVLEYGEVGGQKSEDRSQRAEVRGQSPEVQSPAAVESGSRLAEENRKSKIENRKLPTPASRLDVIGAGNFARTMLLPHLKGRIPFGTVVNATALSANHVKAKFGFQAAATEAAAVLARTAASPAAVLIATRHHLHASLVVQALQAHRHVFVEKPLCLTRDELAATDAALAHSEGTVQVGFNRRFAPASVEVKKLLAATPGPKSCTFRVVPGQLDPHHWYANYAESGGRVLGEACHFFDYFCFLFAAPPVRVFAQTTWPATGRLPFPDSVAAQVEFADGSCGQLIYTAEGDSSFPKETVTVFGTGLVAEITNFQKLVMHRGRKQRASSHHSKGHAEQMAAWAAFLRAEAGHPFPYEQARTSMVLTFAALESIQQARAVAL